MDADYNPQPWQLPEPDDQQKKRLGLNLPQLLPPLSTAPPPPGQSQTFSGTAPALRDSVPDRSLGLPAPQPPSLSEAQPPARLNSPLNDALATPPTSAPSAPVTPLSRAEELRQQGPPKLSGWKLGLDIAGKVLTPGVEPLIPGSSGNYQARLAGAEREEKGALDRSATESEIDLRKAEAEKARREPQDKNKPEPKTVETGDGVYQYNEDSGRYDIKVGPPKSSNKPDTATENKQAFQSVIGKVDAAKLPTDPKSLPRSLDTALKTGKITPEEHQRASGYLAANPTPSTNIQVQTAGAETKQDIKDANTYYRWTGPDGKITTGKGGKVPKGVDAEPIGSDKDYATHLREGQAANIVQQSLNRVAQDIDEHPELFDNATARNIMATSLEQIDRASAGILVAGTGGSIPLPSGMGDMINTALQNKALDPKTAAALKQYIADYRAMKDKGIVQQMEMQGGKIGRGSQQVFQAIIDQIPNGKTADSTTAKRQIQNMQQTQDRLMRQYADKDKEQPYKFKSGGADSQDDPVLKDIVSKLTPSQKAAYNENRKQRGLPPLP